MILQTKDDKYYDVDSYGIKTWGSFSQESIEKHGKSWYFECSYYAPSYEYDDNWETSKIKIPVKAELDALPEGCVLENQEDYEDFCFMMENFDKEYCMSIEFEKENLDDENEQEDQYKLF